MINVLVAFIRTERLWLCAAFLGLSSIYHPIRLQIHPKYEHGTCGSLFLSFCVDGVG